MDPENIEEYISISGFSVGKKRNLAGNQTASKNMLFITASKTLREHLWIEVLWKEIRTVCVWGKGYRSLIITAKATGERC
jgi:hypothetical protein